MFKQSCQQCIMIGVFARMLSPESRRNAPISTKSSHPSLLSGFPCPVLSRCTSMYFLLVSASAYLPGLASLLVSKEQALYFLDQAVLRPDSSNERRGRSDLEEDKHHLVKHLPQMRPWYCFHTRGGCFTLEWGI